MVRARAYSTTSLSLVAEQHADGWTLVFLTNVAVEGLNVEAELAEILGAKLAHLELEGHQAREAAVEEHEVDGEATSRKRRRGGGDLERTTAEVLTLLRPPWRAVRPGQGHGQGRFRARFGASARGIGLPGSSTRTARAQVSHL
jgi:hypothetical protein